MSQGICHQPLLPSIQFRAHHGTGLLRPPIVKLDMPSSTEERLKDDIPFPAGGFSLSFRPVFRMRKLLSRACGDSFVAKTIVFYFQASAMAGLSGLWGGCCVKARAMGCQVATTTLKIRTLRGLRHSRPALGSVIPYLPMHNPDSRIKIPFTPLVGVWSLCASKIYEHRTFVPLVKRITGNIFRNWDIETTRAAVC